MRALKFACKFFLRDLKRGDLRVILVALIVAVAGVSALSSIIMQSRLALDNKSGELLGGDLSIRSYQPLSLALSKTATTYLLKTSHVISFYTMLQSEKGMQLSAVKAVDEHYPLKGHLQISDVLGKDGMRHKQGPEEGTVWLEPGVFALLDVNINDTIQIGNASFRISKVLTLEPGGIGDRFGFAPRAMINIQDVEKTGVLLPGSRARFALFVAGKPANINAFAKAIQSELNESDRVLWARQARPSVETTLARAERYFGLAALVNVVLAGICIALTAQNFVQRHVQTVALMRCLGADDKLILSIFSILLLLLGTVGGIVGTMLGLFVQWGVRFHLKQYLPFSDDLLILQPLILGVGLSVLLTIGFALPSILQLKEIRPVQILRQEQLPLTTSQLMALCFSVLTIGVFIFWQVRDLQVTFYILIATITLSCLAYLMVQALLQVMSKILRRMPYLWRYALRWIMESRRETIMQLIAFGMALTVIMMMWLLKNELLESWQRELPPSTPNYFAININPQQVPVLKNTFSELAISGNALYPLVRGRLIKLNEEFYSVSGEGGRRPGIARPLNITWAMRLPDDNKIIQGNWFSEADKGQRLISLEEGFAKRIGANLGDALTFDFAGQPITAIVKSIRTVRWDNFKPNFFVVFPEHTLQGLPYTLMTSFYVNATQLAQLKLLVRALPGINLIDTTVVLQQVQNILDIVARVIGFLALLTFVIGLLLLLSVMLATQRQRQSEQALFRAMGASNQQLLQLILVEFVSLGVLAGALASLFAQLLTWFLAVEYFNISYLPSVWYLLIGSGGGGILIGGFALIAANRMFRSSPMSALR